MSATLSPMSNVIQFPKPDAVCEEFGGCPRCHSMTARLNVGSGHYCCCDVHRKCWFLGQNLFSDWLHDTEAIWRENAERMNGYEMVFPWFSHKRMEQDDEEGQDIFSGGGPSRDDLSAIGVDVAEPEAFPL